MNMMKYDMPYLIAEIGINHNGHLENAFALIDQAVAAGWNMVKFQKRDPDICVPEAQKNQPRTWEGQEMTYLEYKKKIEFGKQEYEQIRDYCKKKNIEWTVSVWDVPSAIFMMNNFKHDIPFIKIPSACITNKELLDYFNTFHPDMPLLISDGMSTLSELEQTIAAIKNLYGVLHCNSSYPANINELDIYFIPRLKKLLIDRYYNQETDMISKVGFSSHDIYSELSCPLALSQGAEIIEKHITFSPFAEGSDHSCSATLDQMREIKYHLEASVQMLGGTTLKCYPSEERIKKKLRK